MEKAAIELAPRLLNFGMSSMAICESKWSALSGLVNSWLELGISVWIVNRTEQSEPTILDKSCASRTTVFRDTSDRGYITVPSRIYLSSPSPSEAFNLASYLLVILGGEFLLEMAEYISEFGLLFLQEDLKFR